MPSRKRMEQTNNIEALHQMNPEEYPVLYRELIIRKGALLRRLEQIITFGNERFPGWPWFPASVDKLIEHYHGSASTWQTSKAYLVSVGLLKERRPTSKSWSKAMQESVRRAGKGRQAVLWYHVPDYTPELFRAAEQAAERYKAEGINRTGLTIQGAIIAQGKKKAQHDLVDYRTRSERDRAGEYEIIRQIQLAINRKGYATKEPVIKRSTKRIKTAFKLDYIEALCLIRHTWANRNKRLLSMAGVRYGRPTKAQKECFHLKGDGWIITPKAF